jgi:hypothetical protein
MRQTLMRQTLMRQNPERRGLASGGRGVDVVSGSGHSAVEPHRVITFPAITCVRRGS